MNFIKGVRMAIALGMLTAGCAGFADHNAALAPTFPIPAETAALKGTWRGSYGQVGVGNTGHVHGDVVFQVADDGTYSGTWTRHQVAGSSRSSKVNTSGRAAATREAVAFSETSGTAFTLKHSGDKLYGIRRDPMSGQTISIELERVPAAN
jgi:hypothetical protein